MTDSEDAYRDGYKAGYGAGVSDGRGQGYSDAKYRAFAAVAACELEPHVRREVEIAIRNLVGQQTS